MIRRNTALLVLIAPYVVGTLFLTIIPALIAIALSFTNYDSLSAPTWAGLTNYAFIFKYQAFLGGTQNTLTFIILAVPLRISAMLLLSLLLRRPRRGIQIYRV